MTSLIVETPHGRVAGRVSGDVACFRRLPYAPPPTGPRRFAKPGEAPHWPDVRDAAGAGAIPPQLPSRLAAVMGEHFAPQSEDCLHLDIWAPQNLDKPAPVLVFIHGGAFITGGGSLPCYDGEVLAARTGLVVVNVSYRLGVLGFLPIEGVAPPNLGLHDQIAAFRWIRETISCFGGDPGAITAIGQSAGASSIAWLAALPERPALFDRAVLMSAPFGCPPLTRAQTAAAADDVLDALGLSRGDAAAAREAPVERLLEAQSRWLRRASAQAPLGWLPLPFMPALDDDLVPGAPQAAGCDLMIGATREEFAAFHVINPALDDVPDAALRQVFEEAYGEHAQSAWQAARAARAPHTARALLGDLRTRQVFSEPSFDFAAREARTGRPVFAYQFDWQSPMRGLGACHCIDLPFLFGNWDAWRDAPMLAGADPDELADLSAVFQQSIARFAASGDPNAPGLPSWPAYGAQGAVLHFDRRISASCAAG